MIHTNRKTLYIGIGSAFALILLAFSYEQWWLSGDERKAAIAALYSIDSLSDPQLEQSKRTRYEHETSKLLAIAHIAASTRRDKKIAWQLDWYFQNTSLNYSLQQSINSDIPLINRLSKDDPNRQKLIDADEGEYTVTKDWLATLARDRNTLMKELE